jgi:hypothetical protein
VSPWLQLFSSLREQMTATLSRSDALKPLAWVLGIQITATIALVVAHAPDWLLILMSVLLVVIVVLYCWAYTFCLLKDRDALRSERYSLHKLAIENKLIGDSLAGAFEPDDVKPPSSAGTGPDTVKQIEHQS